MFWIRRNLYIVYERFGTSHFEHWSFSSHRKLPFPSAKWKKTIIVCNYLAHLDNHCSGVFSANLLTSATLLPTIVKHRNSTRQFPLSWGEIKRTDHIRFFLNANMTLDVHRPLSHQYESSGPRSTVVPSKHSSSGRKPLQARNLNTLGPAASFNNSSTEEYNSKDMATLNRLSNLESSNNENNKRLTSSSSYGGSSHARRNTSNSEVREETEPVGRTSSRGSALPRPTASSQRQSNLDEDSVVIEEKRRKVNGEGYTVHRYLRGRLLGKGGFAKVYLCTALDTNKAYAIKIVPKSNLVKARARQKVSSAVEKHHAFETD